MIQIYKASAGSGKTFTLAREYIKLILGEKGEDGRYRLRRIGSRPHHDSVLAITFTNKATNEMKSRIIHELAVLAGMERGWEKPSPYLKELCSEFECSAEALSAIAGQALKELLGDFNKFNVSTIDSFFQMVLRSFAHEADVSGSYEVELDDNSVISQSIDTLLQDINHEHQSEDTRRLIEWLTRFMTRLIEDGAKFNIFNRSLQVHKDLVTLITDITDDTYREHEKEILDYLCDPNK
ncbi:MAG: UvrD-helicase domain-containing protein, partial [Duncaniella sp.]|nr:UvrD-helicase domain-containing protein [Duncaniella sp.]